MLTISFPFFTFPLKSICELVKGVMVLLRGVLSFLLGVSFIMGLSSAVFGKQTKKEAFSPQHASIFMNPMLGDAQNLKIILVEEFKEAFTDRKKYINRRPTKITRYGGIHRENPLDVEIRRGDQDVFFRTRDSIRRNDVCDVGTNPLCLSLQPGRALSAEQDQPESLFDADFKMLKTLTAIDEAGLLSHKLSRESTLWSDDYWALAKGVLGARYADTDFLLAADGGTWLDLFQVIFEKGRDLLSLSSGGVDEKNWIDGLSVSEKYDLLIGEPLEAGGWQWPALGVDENQPSGYLTPHQWSVGYTYYKKYGKVEPWMGICHGWAAAAYLMPRPKKKIEVLSHNNKVIPFYPADIKALASYLWAENRVESRFVGGRCNTKDPKKDEHGRVIDEKCFDTNPHTWHLAVVNAIGKENRSIVMDATFDYEVWNQPILGYQYLYFNPVQVESSVNDASEVYKNWQSAAVNITSPQFTKTDPFLKWRYKRTKDGAIDELFYKNNPDKRPHFVVGVAMAVEYLVETKPTQSVTDSAQKDGTKGVIYMYDLEINKHGEVIGGEWYSNAHPDFLWTIPQHSVTNKAYHTLYDKYAVGEWAVNKPLPKHWSELAKQAALRGRFPLGKIVDELIRRSISE